MHVDGKIKISNSALTRTLNKARISEYQTRKGSAHFALWAKEVVVSSRDFSANNDNLVVPLYVTLFYLTNPRHSLFVPFRVSTEAQCLPLFQFAVSRGSQISVQYIGVSIGFFFTILKRCSCKAFPSARRHAPHLTNALGLHFELLLS